MTSKHVQYRVVASDMDETFLARDHSIPQANVDALGGLRAAGVMFVPASGRGYSSIMSSLAPIAHLLEGSYVISYNGACINRVGQDEPLVSHTMPFETLRALYDYGLAHDLGIHVYELSGTVWVANLSEEEKSYLDGHMACTDLPTDAAGRPTIDFLADVPLCKILFAKCDLPYLRELAGEMESAADASPLAATMATVETTLSSGRYLEFMPRGINKGSGLRDLAGILGIGIDQTIAVGDSLNDLPMVLDAGMGVLAANASADVLGQEDYLAQADCDEGVIAEVLEKIVLPAIES